jgi:hypothetical protein
VAHVRDEPPVLSVGRLEPENRLLERADHLVELQGQRAELVVEGDRDAGGEIATGDPLAARAAASTGARTPRATSRATITPTMTTTMVPAIRAIRSWPSVWSIVLSSRMNQMAGPVPETRPPTTRLSRSPTGCHAYAICPRSTRLRTSAGIVSRVREG